MRYKGFMNFGAAAPTTEDRVEKYDHPYELTDAQLLRYRDLPAEAKLRWLDDARRFTLLARQGTRTYFKDGKPVKVVPGDKA